MNEAMEGLEMIMMMMGERIEEGSEWFWVFSGSSKVWN